MKTMVSVAIERKANVPVAKGRKKMVTVSKQRKAIVSGLIVKNKQKPALRSIIFFRMS